MRNLTAVVVAILMVVTAGTLMAAKPAAATSSAPLVTTHANKVAAPVTPLSVDTTIKPNSRLRSGPSTSFSTLAITTATDPTTMECYTHGERVTQNGYTTDVWYFLDFVDDPSFIAFNVWSWAGNVTTLGHVDPDPRLSLC